jgi:hypothetical protein
MRRSHVSAADGPKVAADLHGSFVGSGPDRFRQVVTRGDKLGLEGNGPEACERANNVGVDQEHGVILFEPPAAASAKPEEGASVCVGPERAK